MIPNGPGATSCTPQELPAWPAPGPRSPPPETTRIRLQDAPITCWAPMYLAEGRLRAEGFTEVEYVKVPLAKTLD